MLAGSALHMHDVAAGAGAAEGSRLFFEGASSMNYIPSTPMPAVHMGARMNRRTTMRITILGLKLPSRCILR
eukprot:s227_g26.t1